MSNLEALGLYIGVDDTTFFIYRNHLKTNIINRMARLNQFNFHICSTINVHLHNETILPSNEDIQRQTNNRLQKKILSYRIVGK